MSVIIPNYNHASYLEERLQSVLHQTYEHFEVIVLDDQSTDNSMKIIGQYEHAPHVAHVVCNEQNSGSPFCQWEKGFSLAKGELIWIAESDDSCELDLLKTLVAEFEEDDNCILAFCRSIKIDEQGHSIGQVGMKGGHQHFSGSHFVRHYLSRINFIANASSAIFRKDALPQVDRTYTKLRGCGDWVAWIEIARQGNVAYKDLPLNYFRQHGNNTTNQQSLSGRGEKEVACVIAFLKRKGYIGKKEVYRAQVAHIYSIKYGKLRKLYTNEVRRELLLLWQGNWAIRIFVELAHMLDTFGLHLVNR